ncbi:endopeptidase La [Lentisphaerota bacterium WC36G]|nr:endopeptidase La [Lentisphaerae bacterium WC36]
MSDKNNNDNNNDNSKELNIRIDHSNNEDNDNFSDTEFSEDQTEDFFSDAISKANSNDEESNNSDNPKQNSPNNNPVLEVPILPLDGMLIFPFTLSPLMVEGDENIKLIDKATKADRLVALFPDVPDEHQVHDETSSDIEIQHKIKSFIFKDKKLSQVGILARIVKVLKFPDNTVRVLLRGLQRIEFLEQATMRINGELEQTCFVRKISEAEDNSIETVAMAKNALKQFQEIMSFSPSFPEELRIAILNVDDNIRLVDLVADTLNISYIEKLHILTLRNLSERLQLLTILLNREVEVLHLGSEIQSQVHNAMSRSQREFFLREQLKTIKDELGEENSNPDIVMLRNKMEEVTVPKEVQEVLNKELDRLEMIPQASPEYNIAYSYVDWLLTIPWENYSQDRLDVNKAQKILDKDHYGLNDIKERILDYLAVLQLKKDRKSPILCFVGPPGVGKTSLGQSIARAMKRNFVRISLGGVRDEAEIRGHRRTYVGALPGRIIQGMKKAKTNNPIFMLDEIDKLGNDFRGDPAAALLEVLDPQQNDTFNDHYLEVDYDLSSVMFIATANVLESIPSALLDRMEIIRLPGYTSNEKEQIAKRFLVPRQLKENGLDKQTLTFNKSSIDEIIQYYTREAGVRTLERTIGTVCRKFARKVVTNQVACDKKTSLKGKDIKEYLGARKMTMDEASRKDEVGVVTGMAWTSVGGTILPVEVNMMSGKGNLQLTGQLGDVMKESAKIAFSFIKANAELLKIDSGLFETKDFHIHVPDGATPKDGPSAGVTLTTALVSLLTNRKAKAKVAMTGELTLRGRVTAIGGVKEKVIAAMRSGIKEIILPEENKKDLEDIPDEIKSKLHFHFVKKADEVLKIALAKK